MRGGGVSLAGGDSRTVVTEFDRVARPQVQSRLHLPHAKYGFRIRLPVPAGVQATQVCDLLQVRGGESADRLSPPFRTDPIRPPTAAS